MMNRENERVKRRARAQETHHVHLVKQLRTYLKIILAQADTDWQNDSRIDPRALDPGPRGTLAFLVKHVCDGSRRCNSEGCGHSQDKQ
jgi:hypothetical protein